MHDFKVTIGSFDRRGGRVLQQDDSLGVLMPASDTVKALRAAERTRDDPFCIPAIAQICPEFHSAREATDINRSGCVDRMRLRVAITHRRACTSNQARKRIAVSDCRGRGEEQYRPN